MKSYISLKGDANHLHYAGQQLWNIASYLYSGDTLLHHGYSYYTGHVSCCQWARGNGWAVLAFTEFLSCAQDLGVEDEGVQEIRHLYNHHMRQLLLTQSDSSGLWHNILNKNQTFLETSSSAMFLTGISIILLFINKAFYCCFAQQAAECVPN